MTDEATPSKTYRGNCHCGNFIYTITIPEITRVTSCDCSICSKKGYLWATIPNHNEQFKVVKGDEEVDLTTYQFGSQALLHKFCKTCGSPLFVRWPTGPVEKQMLINSRCLQDFDTWEIPTTAFTGSTYGEPFQAPAFDGPEPSDPKVGETQTYYGSCHCGNIKLAYKTEPLTDKTKVTECNCSICCRNAYLWTYPKREHVVISGISSATTYSHGHGIFLKTFCPHCGVQVKTAARDLSDEEFANCDEQMVPWYKLAKPLQPVNLRLLNGFDLSILKPERSRGWESIQPQYVNP